MKNNWKTTEQMVEDNKRLRAKLESQQPGCTGSVRISDYTTLDNIFDEERDLKAVESGLASKSAVDARGASVAARYVKPIKDQLRDGDVTAEQVNKASEIRRIEGLLATTKPGTTTHRALTAKVANLRADYERIVQTTAGN